jgi:acyl-coenzyme A synthetase/AMP-(fatty) acid ligase
MRLIAALREIGLERGDRVLLRVPTGSDAALLFFAAAGGGLLLVRCSPMLTRREFGVLAAETRARLLIQADKPRGTEEALLPPIVSSPAKPQAPRRSAGSGPFAATVAEDPAFLLHTSGTSGRPKDVLHAHRAVLGRQSARAIGSRTPGSSAGLHARHRAHGFMGGRRNHPPSFRTARSFTLAGPDHRPRGRLPRTGPIPA